MSAGRAIDGVPTPCDFRMPAEGAYLELDYGFVNWGVETTNEPPFVDVLFCDTYAYPAPIPSPLPGCPEPPSPSVRSVPSGSPSPSPSPTESPR